MALRLAVESNKWSRFWYRIAQYILGEQSSHLFPGRKGPPPVLPVLKTCMSFSKWSLAEELLQSISESDTRELIDDKNLMHKMLISYKKKDHVTWVSYLDALLERGMDINSRDRNGETVWVDLNVFRSLEDKTPVSLAKVLLQRGADPFLVNDDGYSLLSLVVTYVGHFKFKPVLSLFELGLVSRHGKDSISPTRIAAKFQNIPVLKLLIEGDVSCNSELRALNSQYQREKAQEADINEPSEDLKQICSILEQAATQPRSLQSLCRVAVSRCLPWGLKRRDMVLSLPIPNVLHEYLLFVYDISDGQAALNEQTRSNDDDEEEDVEEEDDDDDDHDDDDDDDDDDDMEEEEEEEEEEVEYDDDSSDFSDSSGEDDSFRQNGLQA